MLRPPSRPEVIQFQAWRKGIVYSGMFMAILYGIDLAWRVPAIVEFATGHPLIFGTLLGAALFPLGKTLIETFDGSEAFFGRVRLSYRKPILYARAPWLVAALGYAIPTCNGKQRNVKARVIFGLAIGAVAFAGVNLLRDVFYMSSDRGRVQSWRVYLVDGLLGGAIGAAIGFYLDAAQVTIIADKFQRYMAVGQAASPFNEHLLLSQWGSYSLGNSTGGVKLLFSKPWPE